MTDTHRQFLVSSLRRSSPMVSRLLRLGSHVTAIFIVSYVGTLAGGYFVSHHLAGSHITLTELIQSNFMLPLLVVAVAITLGLTGLLLFIEARTDRKASEAAAGRSGAATHISRIAAAATVTPEQHRRLLTLTRSAERLGAVERDLIRRINDSYELDLATHRLIREVQVCTNHVLAQLSEIAPGLREADISERDEAPVGK